MSRKRKLSSASRVAVIGGVFALLAAIVAGVFSLIPRPEKRAADLTIAAFALNEQECYFTRGKESDPDYVEPHYEITEEFDAVAQMFESLDEDRETQEAILAHYRGIYPGLVEEFEKTREVLRSKMSPVFDVVISNTGNVPAVLASLQVDILASGTWVHADYSRPASAPLEVLNRFELKVPAPNEDPRLPDGRQVSVAAMPPIAIQPGDPARFEVVLRADSDHLTYYALRFRFQFSDGAAVATEPFSLYM